MLRDGKYQDYGFWSDARDRLLDKMWRTYAPVEEIITALEELPGHRGMTPRHVKDRAGWLLVKRPADWKSVSARRQYGRPPVPTGEILRLRREGLSLSKAALAAGTHPKTAWLVTQRNRADGR